MTKLKENLCKSYKPEILNCPFCKTKLIYKHAVSNKVIQFSNGRFISFSTEPSDPVVPPSAPP